MSPEQEARLEKIRKMSARDWQLYTTMAGVGAAARSLSGRLATAVKRAFLQLEKEPMLSEQKLAQAIFDDFYGKRGAVMDQEKYAKYGAGDTEPRGALMDALEDAFGFERCTVIRW